MTPDCELLRRYARDGDEVAFAEVVHRQVDLVYSAALRLVGGDTHLAQDVAQGVFTALARQAARLANHASITGWLYTTTRYTAGNLRREQHRRFAREQEAYAMNQPTHAPEMNWDALQPVLDEAVCALAATDREAVLLRFFENKSHREVGDVLGLGEEAARKRVDRALEKLRAHFARRGVAVSASVLAAEIGVNSVQAAPVGLAVTLSGGAIAGAGSTGAFGTLLKTLYMTTKTKIVVTVIILAAAIPLFLQYQKITQLNDQITVLRHGIAHPARSQNQAASVSHQLTPEEVLAKLKVLKKENKLFGVKWQAFLDALSPADIPKVIAGLDQLNLTNTRFMAAFMVFWGKNDPQAALAYMYKSPGSRARNNKIGSIIEGWADVDPQAAVAWWQQLPPGQARMDMAATVIGAMMEKDPQAAYQLTLGLDPSSRSSLTGTLFGSWADTDPAGALAQIAQLPGGQWREEAITAFARSCAAGDPQAAFTWANALPGGEDKTNALRGVIPALAASNPQEATAYALNLPPGPTRTDNIVMVASTLANNNDLQGAWSLVQQMADGQARQTAESQIVRQYAQSDPAGAITFLEGLATPPTNLLTNIASNWAQNAPNDAIAELASLPDGPAHDTYLSGLFNGLVKNSPQDAEKMVSSLPVDQQSAAANKIADSLATFDPPAAAAWMSSLPEGVTNTTTFNTVVTSWARYDPAASGEWIQTLSAGTTRDAAIQSYVGAIADFYPVAAAPLTTSISDPDGRKAAIEKVAQSWLKINPTAAAAWLKQTSLPVDQQQELLNQGH